MGNSRHRSFEKITRADLRQLSMLASANFGSFFDRFKRWRPYEGRLMLICLCQGAAGHYVEPDRAVRNDREGGVNDFDIWGFFRHRPKRRPFPPRRHGFEDFGPSKFGRNTDDHPRFTGRRVDVLGRSIDVRRSESPIQSMQRYLEEGATESARRLAERPVVVLWPSEMCGKVIWRGTKRA